MGFVGNYAPCGLSPQTDGMPVIPKNAAANMSFCGGIFLSQRLIYNNIIRLLKDLSRRQCIDARFL